MFGHVDGVYALSLGGTDFSGLAYSLPTPVLVIVLIVFVMAAIGMMSRVKAIFQGKGTALDFVGVVIILVLFVVVMLVVGSGVVRGLNINVGR